MIVDVWRRFRAQRGAVAALYTLIVIVALSLLAPLIAPQDPSDPLGFDPLAANHPPTLSWIYLFGADGRGRDMLSLLLWGGRTTLSIGVGAAILAALVGADLGALACWRGGVFDPLLSRLMDVCGAPPPLLVLLLLASRLGGAPAAVMLAVFALSGWVVPARLTRTAVRAGLAAPYVEAARAMGVTGSRLLFVHLLPAALPPVAAWTAAAASAYVALEAGLDFLGLGLPAGTTSWGTALAGAQAAVSAGNWWWMTFGGIALAVSTLALAGVARGVARALDPTMPVMSIARGHTAITFALDAAGPQSENRRGGRARLSPRAVVGGGLGGAIPPGSPWARWTAGRSRGASQPWAEGGIGNDAAIPRLRAVWSAPRKATALSSDRTMLSWRRRWTRPIAVIGAALLLVTVIGVAARSHDMRHAPRPAALLNNAAAYPTQRGQRAAYIATATYAVVEGIDPSTRGLPWAAYDSCPAPLMGKRCARADVQLWFGAGQGRAQSEGSTYICTPRLTWGLNPMAGLATTVRTPCDPLGPAMVGLGATAGVAQRLLPAITRGARDDARLT
ncbi:MAG: ABC transporter permease, partial [Chloroflexota bacterium]|nr:ABC transporter permease [Chloroflexota bacterium]